MMGDHNMGKQTVYSVPFPLQVSPFLALPILGLIAPVLLFFVPLSLAVLLSS
jgi:hypothetical protein